MIVYDINDYVVELLKQQCDWGTIGKSNLNPMVPVQRQPEFLDQSKPFAVYIASNDFNPGGIPAASTVIAYGVYARTHKEVNDAIELIFDAFADYHSQDTLNEYLQSIDSDYRVNFTSAMDLESSSPVGEAERKQGMVSVRVGYRPKVRSFKIAPEPEPEPEPVPDEEP